MSSKPFDLGLMIWLDQPVSAVKELAVAAVQLRHPTLIASSTADCEIGTIVDFDMDEGTVGETLAHIQELKPVIAEVCS